MKTLSALLVLLATLIPSQVQAQSERSSDYPRLQWNNGLTVSPQMLFVGALDVGVFSNVEIHPFGNPVALLGGVDLRNKILQLDMSNSGLDTKSLKTHYSANLIAYAGAGYSFLSKKGELNSFYLTAAPYFFAFKETVDTPYINNTTKNSSLNFNAGLTWTSSKKTKRGRTLSTQLYFPLVGKHILDELRIMNLKVGLSI